VELAPYGLSIGRSVKSYTYLNIRVAGHLA